MLNVRDNGATFSTTGDAGVSSHSVDRTVGAVSREAKHIDQVLYPVTARSSTLFSDAGQLPQSAFELKSALAPISMHLSKAWRQSIFNQLDEMLCEEAWDLEDAVPSKSSWATFIRLIVYCRFKVLPGLGFSDENPMLSWVNHSIRINITCYPNDTVRWTASRLVEYDIETSIGDTKPRRVRAMLAAYNDGNWLLDG